MGKRILVLDDDQNILDIVSFILTEDGYEVQTVSTGEELFSIIRQFDPQLVLMDVMLGNMDGRVICRDLKQSNETNHLPVILISGTHDLADSLKQIGAPNDFIPKPFDLEVLLKKVKSQMP